MKTYSSTKQSVAFQVFVIGLSLVETAFFFLLSLFKSNIVTRFKSSFINAQICFDNSKWNLMMDGSRWNGSRWW